MKEKYVFDMLKELSPFNSMYFFLLFGLACFVLAINLPIENYAGLSFKARSVNGKHRLLFDASFFVTLFMSTYIVLRYKKCGFSTTLKCEIRKNVQLADEKRQNDAGKPIKKGVAISYLFYILMFLAMYAGPASNSPKYYQLYYGHIALAFGHVLFFHIVFMSMLLLIVHCYEARQYIQRKYE